METILIAILEFFYDSWERIVAVSVILGIIATMGFKININKKVISVLCSIFAIFAVYAFYVHENYVRVPDLLDQSIDTALHDLRECGLTVEMKNGQTFDKNKSVKSQDPDKDTLVRKGTTVEIGYENSTDSFPELESKDYLLVPDVINMEQTDATKLIHLSGLEYQVTWDAESFSYDVLCYVIEQHPGANAQVHAGDEIILELSSEKPDEIKYPPCELVRGRKKHDGYFILHDDASSEPSKMNIETGEVTSIELAELAEEDFVHVELDSYNIDFSKTFIFLTVNDISEGIRLSNDKKKWSFWITPGNYIAVVDFGNEKKCAKLDIKKGGHYQLAFE